jgi:hypothetical protein
MKRGNAAPKKPKDNPDIVLRSHLNRPRSLVFAFWPEGGEETFYRQAVEW